MEESADVSGAASTGEVLCYRQRVEKSTGGEITLMQWSPTMDLLAAAFVDNSVVLNRLSWQRVWSILPSESVVTALAWRPDGKVLSVGRSDGSVCLYSVEDGQPLHEFSARAPISSLQWALQSEESYISTSDVDYEDRLPQFLPPLPALDASQGGFTNKAGNGEGKHPLDPKQLKTLLTQMNVLMTGDEVGRIHLCVSGVLLAAAIGTTDNQERSLPAPLRGIMLSEPKAYLSEFYSFYCCPVPEEWLDNQNIPILGLSIKVSDWTSIRNLESNQLLFTCISDELKLVSGATLKQQGGWAKLCFHTLNTPLVAMRSHELQYLALKFGHIGSLLEYMSASLKSMHEAWEDLLLMMDTKLTSYASTLPEGRTVSDEFLVLLACGRARPELQSFLVDELTAKGVKKLGLSLELSYTSIRKYALSYLNRAIQCLQFHLGEVLGMARWYNRFGVLGLSEAAIQDCINHLGTFALKSQELLLAIDDSLQCIKVFFQWLYVVILRLSDEPIPAGLKEHLSPEKLKLVIEFLKKRLSKASADDSQTFNLEVVGQYLIDEDLRYVEEKPQSLWEKIRTEANLTTGNVAWLFQPSPKKSLVQLFHALHKSVDVAFAMPMESICESFSQELNLELAAFKLEDDGSFEQTARKIRPLVGEFVCEGSHYVYFPCGEHIVLLKYGSSDEPLECCKLHISEVPSLVGEPMPSCHILTLQYYDAMDAAAQALSILFEHNGSDSSIDATDTSHAVAQLPIEVIEGLSLETVTPCDLVTTITNMRSIDVGPSLTQVLSLSPFTPCTMAVSGARRLAAVLSSNNKKIRLFDVDAEEEEEEEED